MTHTKTITQYVTSFVDALVQSGLKEVVISPGSRSTPLAMTVCEHEGICEWVIIDERSAAFFALGMAQQTKRPVGLICTSGSAAANYFPAIVEAYHNRIPLLVLTADRPHELRDVGAPQAIDQVNLYGNYVKWFKEMAIPEATPRMLTYVQQTARRALMVSASDIPGPVHLNFPFREPLMPDFSLQENANANETNNLPLAQPVNGLKRLTDEHIQMIIKQLHGREKGLIVCGPHVNKRLAEAIVNLAQTWDIPVLADPLSQLRAGDHEKDHLIISYDAILRNEHIRTQLKPDFIIRFGAMPISKMYLFYVEEHTDALQFVVEDHGGYRDPTSQLSEFIYADSESLCYDLIKASENIRMNSKWLRMWKEMDQLAQKHLFTPSERKITEGEAIRGLLEVIPHQSYLYIGNSMPVRDLDTFFKPTEKDITILGNRGTNGIDGMVSSAVGAAATGERVTLVLGDVSFYHDLNGLLATKHYHIDITIVVINNDGGGIFSFLPQAQDKKHFEKLFGTPLNIDFQHVVKMYGGHYTVVTHETELQTELLKSYDTKGLSVIEIQTERSENTSWHRHKWQLIEQDLLKASDLFEF